MGDEGRCRGKQSLEQSYGGSADDGGSGIAAAKGGGYIIAGTTTSNNGDVSGNHGNNDGWLLRITQSGEKVWSALYGGVSNGDANAIIALQDGSYVVTGSASVNLAYNGWLFRFKNH